MAQNIPSSKGRKSETHTLRFLLSLRLLRFSLRFLMTLSLTLSVALVRGMSRGR